MDKNHDAALAALGASSPSIVLCTEPFHKAEMVHELAGAAGCPAVVIDTDLLYTGYLASGMMRGRGAEVVAPRPGGWREAVSGIASRISESRHLVLVDSLNGAYGMLGAYVPAVSSVMLLGCAARRAGSSVVALAVARRREDGRWALSPGGRQVPRPAGAAAFLLARKGGRLVLSRLDGSGNPDPRSETPL